MESIVDNKDKLHFYQYLEVDLLQQYLRTGIQYFVNAILNSHTSLVPLRYWSLEISTAIDFIKDFLYLKANRATYAENFYNLERGELGKWGALKGAFVWAILPYLGTKIDNYYNNIVADEIDGHRITTFKKIIKTIYPYLYAIIGLVQTFHKFRYLYLQKQKDSYYYHLLYKFQHLHLKHKPTEEQAKYPILQLLKKPGLLIVLIGHKILTWYFSQKKERKSIGNRSQEAVSAPHAAYKVQQNGLCQICTKKIENPTMVRPSGYVYCWQCITNYVSRENHCPMSGIKVAGQDLQIIYG